MIFDTDKNTLTAYGTIDEGNGIAFISHLNTLESKHASIIIKLHTYGGSVFDGNLMYNAIVNSPADIEIHIVGIAASMGAVISLASNKVYMVENGYMMLHAPSGGTYGTVNDHENNIKLLQAIEANFIKKLINKTGKSEDYVSKWLNGDNWLDANEALNERLITGIIEPETKNIGVLNPKQLGIKETYKKYSALLTQNLKINTDMDLLQSLIEVLELPQNATADDAVNKVKELVEGSKKMNEQNLKEADMLIADALKKGAIQHTQKTFITKMFASDFTNAKQFLSTLKPRVPIASMIVPRDNTEDKNPKDKSHWTLNDYRRNAPKELEGNPELYKRLIEENKQ